MSERSSNEQFVYDQIEEAAECGEPISAAAAREISRWFQAPPNQFSVFAHTGEMRLPSLLRDIDRELGEPYDDAAKVALHALKDFVRRTAPQMRAYAEIFGDDERISTEFEQRYLGTFGSFAQYVENTLEEAGSLRGLEEAGDLEEAIIPDDLREFVCQDVRGLYLVDYEAIGRAWLAAGGYALAETDDGRVMVFHSHA